MARLLYTVNIPRFFVSHRMSLALAAAREGYDVHVATSGDDKEYVARIAAAGLPFHPLPIAQHGTRPLEEAKALVATARVYRRLRPDIVHHVSIKPVLYGGIAARVAGIRAVVGAMSGLGFVFVDASPKARLIRAVTRPLLGFALGHPNSRMIFQNVEDRRIFTQMGLVRGRTAVLIRGSGVDTTVFSPSAEPQGKPVVLFAGRLMWQKGVHAFIDAARLLRDKARFVIAGFAEPTSPGAVPEHQLAAWAAENLIEWWGRCDDMPRIFAQCHVVCLPTRYGEGVPKVLIEAAACGRAIVATDIAGCREIVRHGYTGLLTPPGDQQALVAALDRLLGDPLLRRRLGQGGRELAAQEFSLRLVIEQTLDVYRQLLGDEHHRASAGVTA